MTIAFYLLYAFVQGVFTSRAIDDGTAPVGMAVICMIFAPIVTVLWIGNGFHKTVEFLVTRGKK